MGNAQEINTDSTKGMIDKRIRELLDGMSLEEKIGQLNQVQAVGADSVDVLAEDIRAGRIGSIINLTDPAIINELQRIAVEESRLGIPLLIGRDVVHGFQTVAPLPLGQAASFNPDLVQACARLAAEEASAAGVNWTFAPMLDVSRDPRWGRIAESFGEDPYLCGVMGAAMIRGFQESDNSGADTLQACAKHFVGYGASESGLDYNTTNIPENELRDVHLPPFKAAVQAGAATFMTSFSDVDGLPATANDYLLREILRDEWDFDGLVVSDWDSIHQLTVHGLCETDEEATFAAASAGVDMDMIGGLYQAHLPGLIESGRLPADRVDTLVANVLRVKVRAGLLDRDVTALPAEPSRMMAAALVREAADQSLVLLKNDRHVLPLDLAAISSVAVIGPLADAPADQLGTWVFDGDPGRSVTPLEALRTTLEPEIQVSYAPALRTSRDRSEDGFFLAEESASGADIVLMFVGEDAILSGEAHSRADLTLPGAQSQLVRRIRNAGKPVVGVIMAGRPLVLTEDIDHFDALVFAGHPGSMAGPAIVDMLIGRTNPSGKLPVTFPCMTGQVPIYYARKNTGRPAESEEIILIDQIAEDATQTSLGMTAFFLDAGHLPLFHFGHGLSYTQFDYAGLNLNRSEIAMGESLTAEFTLTNTGARAGTEIVQLYTRDRFGSLTRPVRELKGFQRVTLEPGESRRIRFSLHTDDLAFNRRDGRFAAEPGDFDLWVSSSSVGGLHAAFAIKA